MVWQVGSSWLACDVVAIYPRIPHGVAVQKLANALIL